MNITLSPPTIPPPSPSVASPFNSTIQPSQPSRSNSTTPLPPPTDGGSQGPSNASSPTTTPPPHFPSAESPPPGYFSLPPRSSPPPPLAPLPSNNSSGKPIHPAPLRPPVPSGSQAPRSPPSNGNLAPPGGNTTTDYSSTSQDDGRGRKLSGGVAAGIGMLAAVLVLLAVMVVWVKRKKSRLSDYHGDYTVPTPNGSSQMLAKELVLSGSYNSGGSSTPLVKTTSEGMGISYLTLNPAMGNNKSLFSYEELTEITNGFSPENILGQGGFGCVYKGCLPDGTEVAVKQLKTGGSQGEREFQAEVGIISRVHHRHLVSLVGYCVQQNQRLLVYDYVPNRTLHYHLHGRGRMVMDWPTRVKIAAGAARGLAYLHEDCHPRIIHRDIKSSNILLDNNFEALVADFGLAKLSADTNTHVSTRVMGTFGYLAPEYASTGKLTDKSDVFSFGVVLLELITGQKPIDASRTMGDESLVEWARPLMIHALETGTVDGLADRRLEGNYNPNEMSRMIEAASACVRYNATMRPKMGRVMQALDNIVSSLDLNNGVIPGQTQVFNPQSSAADMKHFHQMAFGSQDYSSDLSRNNWNQKNL